MKINIDSLDKSLFKSSKPFNYIVIDNFLDLSVAKKIEESFYDYDSPEWHVYSNEIEEKKTINNWNLFSDVIYDFFSSLNSVSFTKLLSSKLGLDLIPDFGLHGGGLHIHKGGGNLNPHLDYSIHPKLKLQRKINIIYYCSSSQDLLNSQTGQLGLWSGSSSSPSSLDKIIDPVFNRAVIFDTTQNSWHGLVNPLPVNCDFSRKSLAFYYLQQPDCNADSRTRALFAPRDYQSNNDDVLNLIKKRSSESGHSDVYITK